MPTFFYRRPYGMAATLNFPLYDPTTGQRVSAAAHAAGDSVIMKDEGTPGNTGSGFVDEGATYSLALTAAELQCKRAVVDVDDLTATKVWLDTTLVVETEGDELSQHPARHLGVLLATTIDTVNSQTEFVLTSGPNDNNSLLNCLIVIIDNSTPESVPDRGRAMSASYTGTTKTLGIDAAMPFTAAAGDLLIALPASTVATAAEIADAVLDELTSEHTTVGSLGKRIEDTETDIATLQTTANDNGTAIADVDTAVALVPQTTARLLRARKNATFDDIPFKMIDSSDQVSGKTGLTVTVQRSIDGAAFGSGTGTATEIANGNYQYDASAADMNGDKILFRFTGTGALATELTIFTTP